MIACVCVLQVRVQACGAAALSRLSQRSHHPARTARALHHTSPHAHPSSHHLPLQGARVPQLQGAAKVAELPGAAVGAEDVLGLDVAVHDALRFLFT